MCHQTDYEQLRQSS